MRLVETLEQKLKLDPKYKQQVEVERTVQGMELSMSPVIGIHVQVKLNIVNNIFVVVLHNLFESSMRQIC
jgi:hypothetical protein